ARGRPPGYRSEAGGALSLHRLEGGARDRPSHAPELRPQQRGHDVPDRSRLSPVDLDLLALAHDLARRGEPFALATVVHCERPTSAKPGARALIRRDGAVSGWIGGGRRRRARGEEGG